MLRILLGGVVAGLLFFGWGYLSHEQLPIGRMGFSELPNEGVVMASVKLTVNKPGLYFFPWASAKPTADEKTAWEEKYKAGPSGVLVVHPGGREPMTMKMLAIELVSDILAALLAAWVLSLMGVGYGARVGVVTAFGFFAWLTIEISYWNWYGFPRDYLLGQLIDQVGGSLIAALGMAAIVKPPSMLDEANL